MAFVVNSFLSGNRMGKRSTKGGARRASLFTSSESGPNPARTVIYSVRVRASKTWCSSTKE